MPSGRPFKDFNASIGKPRKLVEESDLPDGILRWEKLETKFRIVLKVDGIKKQILFSEVNARKLAEFLNKELQ